MLTKAKIAQKANEICEQNNITHYPVNIVDICNAMGIAVYEQYLPSKVAGFIGVDDSLRERYHTDKVIVVNLADRAVRRRFTIAHELAHYVLHKKKDETLYAHRDVIDTPQRGIEREANIFASNILMPERMVRDVLEELEERDFFAAFDEKIRYIANEFKVSKEAARVRLQDLKII